MFYDIGSVSNRNIQLLYDYRILRLPSDCLSAICREGEHDEVSELYWEESSREIEGFDVIYQAKLPGVSIKKNSVPFFEFYPKSSEWKWIADFIDIEVSENGLTLYSSTNYLTNISVSVYWCYSLRHIESLLLDILEELGRLIKDYDKLADSVKNFKDTGSYLTRPNGLVPNLVKIQGSELVDSLYRIKTAESGRLFVNYSQDNLNHMEHIFNESVEFRFLDKDHYVVDSFVSPVMTISGNGDLVLRNLAGQVLVTNWEGTITVFDCAEVHLVAKDEDSICNLSELQIGKNSTVYLENQVHNIKKLSLYANSLCRHWRANVQNLEYVGPSCTYWCCSKVSVPGRVQLDRYLNTSNTVFDFNIHDILGFFVSDFDNIMIVGQKNLTTRLGNFDPEPQPGMYVPSWTAQYNTIISSNTGGKPGPGTLFETTIDGLTSWVWMPENCDNVGLILCVPGVAGGIQEATVNFGAWKAVEIVRPRAACLFIQRPSYGTLPSLDLVFQKIQELQNEYGLGTSLWYFGFSAGANAYPLVSNYFINKKSAFRGAVLIDCNDPSSCVFSTVGLEKVMVVQGAMHVGSSYDYLRNSIAEFTIYDYNGAHTHASVNYWTPSDSETTYQEIAGVYYEQIPDLPPNGLVWLCGGNALPTGGAS